MLKNFRRSAIKLNLNIDLARGCGFCFGVRKALKKAEEALENHDKIYLLGDIVHNERVVDDLSRRGAVVISSLDETNGSPLLFRAHGTEKSIVEEAKRRGIEAIDATCPLVTLIHDEVRELYDEGRHIIVIGDQGHEEVLGIASQVPEAMIVSSREEAEKLPKYKSIGVVTQSTQMRENVQAIICELFTKTQDLRIKNTICHPTTTNQAEVERISRENDAVIVIGSTTSANSKRLLAMSLKHNPRSYMISGREEIDPAWFREGDRVGVTAGASTPDETIRETIETLKTL